MTPETAIPEAESRKRLMSLMTRHQRQIFGYIFALVPNRYDAEDLLQETSLVICEKFEEFELSESTQAEHGMIEGSDLLDSDFPAGRSMYGRADDAVGAFTNDIQYLILCACVQIKTTGSTMLRETRTMWKMDLLPTLNLTFRGAD